MPAGVLLGDREGQVSCAKGLFRAAFFAPEWSDHLVGQALGWDVSWIDRRTRRADSSIYSPTTR